MPTNSVITTALECFVEDARVNSALLLEAQNASSVQIFFSHALLIAFAFAGVLLVFLLFICNLTVSEGQ